MAQSEDVELRDLVVESLEKNGSLAKIRALLRANVFLAFEDDCANLKQNRYLDEILKTPEGLLSLNVIHEFLEFLNLKNTLFVYTAETRQGKEYSYGGAKKLAAKFDFAQAQNSKEPLLVGFVRKFMKTSHRHFYEQGDAQLKDEQNCTYIVHDDCSNESSNDTSSQTHSQSEHSAEEKNNLHLRLPLDQSDTDTSSDTSREKTSSEYIPSEHIIIQDESDEEIKAKTQSDLRSTETDYASNFSKSLNNGSSGILKQLQKVTINSNSSESTSYLHLKPFTSADEKMLNTSGLPTVIENKIENISHNSSNSKTLNMDTLSSAILNITSSIQTPGNKDGSISIKNIEDVKEASTSLEYSQDFTTSSTLNKSLEKTYKTVTNMALKGEALESTVNLPDSPQQNSQSSQSSISISDIPDLIEISGSSSPSSKQNARDKSKTKLQFGSKDYRKNLNNSDEFSDSPIPSLSNLSLDFHSD